MSGTLLDTALHLAMLGIGKAARHAALYVILGDSRVDQTHLDHGSFLNISNANHFGWGNALSGHRITIESNQGNSGDRSDQMLARLAACLSGKAGSLYIEIGANDIAQAATGFVSLAGPMVGQTINLANVAQHILANVKLAYAAALKAGFVRVIVVLEAGATNFSATQIAAMMEYNQRLREWSETVPAQALFDLPSYLWDASASTASAIAFKTGYMRDTTHEAAPGAYAGGLGFAALLTQLHPLAPRELRNVFEVPSANSNINQLTNPMFATATGGTAGGGVSGSVPLGWTVSRVTSYGSGGGAQTCAVSTGTPADGSPGKECILALTFAAAGDTFALVQDWPLANWSAGDIIQAGGEVSIDNATGLAAASLYLQSNGSGNGFGAKVAGDVVAIDNSQFATGAVKYSMLSEKLVIPNYTTKSWVTQHFEFKAAAAGTVTVRIRRAMGKRRFS